MYLRNIKQLSIKSNKIAGRKATALGELTKLKVNVPGGFVILAKVFDEFLKENNLAENIEKIFEKINYKNISSIGKASNKIKKIFDGASISKDIIREILDEYKKLEVPLIAVRSSATAEDSARASWAGQLESYLNVSEKNILRSVKKCWASLFSLRAIAYRFGRNLEKKEISVAVIIQEMIQSKISGTCFTANPVSRNKNQLVIESSFGLGEAIVSGKITPDNYVVQKITRRIVGKNIQTRQILPDKKILELSKIAMKIEEHFKKPQDIEWCFTNGEFYIVQSRPITTL
jgi:pyruvate,water dikinase